MPNNIQFTANYTSILNEVYQCQDDRRQQGDCGYQVRAHKGREAAQENRFPSESTRASIQDINASIAEVQATYTNLTEGAKASNNTTALPAIRKRAPARSVASYGSSQPDRGALLRHIEMI